MEPGSADAADNDRLIDICGASVVGGDSDGADRRTCVLAFANLKNPARRTVASTWACARALTAAIDAACPPDRGEADFVVGAVELKGFVPASSVGGDDDTAAGTSTRVSAASTTIWGCDGDSGENNRRRTVTA